MDAMFGSTRDWDLPPPQVSTSAAPVASASASTSTSKSAIDASSSSSSVVGLDKRPTTDKKPAKSGRRRLACEPCRARRIKCAWQAETSQSCIACDEADLKCPGEAQPRKRRKRCDSAQAQQAHAHAQEPKPLELAVDTKPDIVQADQYELGGALTFHLIQLCFNMANPCISGLDYDLFQALLNNSAGVSRELEVAAETLCGALIAVSVTFSDHELFIGPSPKPEIPYDEPSGIKASVAQYDKLVSFGRRRQEAVQHFVTRALKLYAESRIDYYPSIEAIYTMLAMDHCLSLTTEGIRTQRRFVDSAIEMFKLLTRRRAELPKPIQEALIGPLSHTLLSLDAQTAAVLKTPSAISNDELGFYFPQIQLDDTFFSSLHHPSRIIDRKQGWTELGKQTASIGMVITRLYRRLVDNGNRLGYHISEIWRGVEMVRLWLDDAEATVLCRLTPLASKELTDERAFDLISLLNFHRRNLFRLDLLVHQRIVDAAAKDPAPIALQLYATSCARVQALFKLVVVMAKEITRTSALIQARRLFEVLECCLTWSSMRSSRPPEVADLITELGITKDMGTTIMNMLALASWSSALADVQRRSLRNGFTHLSKQATPAPEPTPVVEVKEQPKPDPIAPTRAASVPDPTPPPLSHAPCVIGHPILPIIPPEYPSMSMYPTQPPITQANIFPTPLTYGSIVSPIIPFATPSFLGDEASFETSLPPQQNSYDAAFEFLMSGTNKPHF
ncbi:hypothetical protein MVLG_04750 [Microbotryum lychnidis-dioicae p1A1 Lamole]|uniref:Zn(2)-C6 fungal-type domain-containing protein n=1 Tax=Microbotryum lychnidis-dioicae (strain p1A1 Lamole / MvSl-1064) TaxID=683840 RepID=U5HC63_USTV1|nr:hypothetical protein MVLG_04750 [Microbotryum lychnidis-dioicae p1A1 Lamole]|eukprot:KDE04786.1 hypothetical protein MVLG_04750 [Microbotryum lychnidis-dioicae p1A1 Lamole]